MYKILIKYISKSSKTFWYNHEVINENGESIEFETDNFEILKEEVNKLDKQIGYENLRIINDVTYSITVNIVDDLENVTVTTSEDIEDMYTTAFANIFGEVNNG